MYPNNQRRRKRQIRASKYSNMKNNLQYLPVNVRPDHRVTVRHIQKISNLHTGPGYFDSYEIVKPYDILTNSSYSPLLTIYDQLRVTRIVAKVWIPNTSINTPGVTGFMYYKEYLSNIPSRFVEQLFVEPGSQRGRPSKVFKFTWKPIEPTDYEFYTKGQASDMDNKKYGQVNYAGAGFGSFEPSKPIIEYIIDYDFKSLTKPEAPPNVGRVLTEFPDEEEDIEEQYQDYVAPPRSTSNRSLCRRNR